MNDLERWLADVKEFNESAGALHISATVHAREGAAIESRGRALGLKRSKIKSTLARVRLKVEMPEEPKAGT